MIRYAITNRRMHVGSETERCAHLLEDAVRLASAGVDYLQVREKDLPFDDAAHLASEALIRIRAAGFAMEVLLNAEWRGVESWPAGVGLHLSAASLALLERRLLEQGGSDNEVRLPAVVSASCHGVEELRAAKRFATLLLFAPVFEKRVDGHVVQPGRGLESLAKMCRAAAPLPVLAMGGVTMHNADACLSAGAGGIAGIRLFQ
jgi:thiamine-phosphate pyrophosphorylase